MTLAGINYLAVILAAIASFLFGGVWYGVLSKAWLSAVGRTFEEVMGQGAPMTAYAVTAASQLVMAAALAVLIAPIGGDVSIRSGLMAAGFVWLGFVMTSLVVNHTFQGQRGLLTLIDGGHWLGVLLVQGLVLGAIGV